MTCYIARGWVLACPVYLFYDSPIDSPQAAPELMARHPALEWWLSGMLALVRLFWAPSTRMPAPAAPSTPLGSTPRSAPAARSGCASWAITARWTPGTPASRPSTRSGGCSASHQTR